MKRISTLNLRRSHHLCAIPRNLQLMRHFARRATARAGRFVLDLLDWDECRFELLESAHSCPTCPEIVDYTHRCPNAVEGRCLTCGLTVDLDRYGRCPQGHSEMAWRRFTHPLERWGVS